MKKILIIFLFSALLTGCAATGPVGQWDYSVTGTPQGDYSGIMTVAREKDVYTAKLSSQAGEISFEKFTYDKKSRKLTGNFFFSGVDVILDAKTEKAQMKGVMSAGGGEFPFVATKKK